MTQYEVYRAMGGTLSQDELDKLPDLEWDEKRQEWNDPLTRNKEN